MGSGDFAAAEFGWRGDYRSAEYAEGCAAEGLGRRGKRAHGGGNDAAGGCGSRGLLCRSRFFKCAGGGGGGLVFPERGGGEQLFAARVLRPKPACGGAPNL